MRTAREIAMACMLSDGWNMMSDGDVESPTGYFYVVEVDGSEEFQQYSTGDEAADEWLYSATPGHYLVREDSLGFMHIEHVTSEDMAHAWFGRMQREFIEWAGDSE